jgi:hypothetical protein
MRRENIVLHGLPLERWTHASCTADFAVGPNWATLYLIQSEQRRQGHATALLTAAKAYYESQGKRFGGSAALNAQMRRLYERLGIKEYSA